MKGNETKGRSSGEEPLVTKGKTPVWLESCSLLFRSPSQFVTLLLLACNADLS